MQNVPNDHLRHLIDTVLSKHPKRHDFKKTLEDAGDKADIEKALEQAQPGITDKLNETWSMEEGRAAHVWTAAGIGGLRHPLAIAKQIRDGFGVSPLQPGKPGEFKPGKKGVGEAALVRAYVYDVKDGTAVDLTVRLFGKHSYQDNGVRVWVTKSRDVDVHLHMPSDVKKVSTVEVRAQPNIALQGMKYVMAAFLGPLPSRKQQDDLFAPHVFFPNKVAVLAADRSWEGIGFSEEPSGENVIRGVYGKRNGRKFYAVKESPKAGSKTDDVGYQPSFKHKDGFEETIPLRFIFLVSRHPHVTFLSRVSRPGARYIMDLLRLHT